MNVSEIIRKHIFYLCILLFIAVSCGENESGKKVIAKVGDHKIYLSDFQKRYEGFLAASGVKDHIYVRKSVLNTIIDETLLFNYDKSSGVKENPEYLKELEWRKKQAILAYLKDREIYAKIIPTEEELRKAYYRTNQKITVRHLFAATENEAEELYNLLKAGADFETLAASVFTDSTLRANGGYLGEFSWGELDPDFEEAAFSLKPGEISKPVQTEFGYSIIKLENIVTNPILTEHEFNQNRNGLNRAVRINKKRPAEKAYIKSVIDTKEFSFNEGILEKILKSLPHTEKLELLEKEEPLPTGVCMKYRDDEFSASDIMEMLETVPEFHLEKATDLSKLKIILKGLLLQRELLKIAEKKGYDNEKAVQKIFKNLELNLFMKYKLQEIVYETELEDSVVYNFYKEHPEMFSSPREVNVREIIINDKKLADDLAGRLKKGAEFGKLARKFSLRKFSAQNNGEIGFAHLSKFGILKDKFWKADMNKIIGPVQVEDMWGIFEVIGRKESSLMNYDEIRELVELTTKHFTQRDLLDEYSSGLRTIAGTEIDTELLGSYKTLEDKVN